MGSQPFCHNTCIYQPEHTHTHTLDEKSEHLEAHEMTWLLLLNTRSYMNPFGTNFCYIMCNGFSVPNNVPNTSFLHEVLSFCCWLVYSCAWIQWMEILALAIYGDCHNFDSKDDFVLVGVVFVRISGFNFSSFTIHYPVLCEIRYYERAFPLSTIANHCFLCVLNIQCKHFTYVRQSVCNTYSTHRRACAVFYDNCLQYWTIDMEMLLRVRSVSLTGFDFQLYSFMRCVYLAYTE